MPRTPSGRPRRSPYTRRGLGWAAALAAAFAVLAGVVLTRHGTPYPWTPARSTGRYGTARTAG